MTDDEKVGFYCAKPKKTHLFKGQLDLDRWDPRQRTLDDAERR